MNNKITILLVLLFFYTLPYAQNIKNEDKIDPVFGSLISTYKTKKIALNKKCLGSKPAAKGSVLKSELERRIYDCIVYTKSAKTLKDKGIIVGSTLPTFVTARATLAQIEQMATMEEVTYIEAPETNYPN
jgi:hypothetical protein